MLCLSSDDEVEEANGIPPSDSEFDTNKDEKKEVNCTSLFKDCCCVDSYGLLSDLL